MGTVNDICWISKQRKQLKKPKNTDSAQEPLIDISKQTVKTVKLIRLKPKKDQPCRNFTQKLVDSLHEMRYTLDTKYAEDYIKDSIPKDEPISQVSLFLKLCSKPHVDCNQPIRCKCLVSDCVGNNTDNIADKARKPTDETDKSPYKADKLPYKTDKPPYKTDKPPDKADKPCDKTNKPAENCKKCIGKKKPCPACCMPCQSKPNTHKFDGQKEKCLKDQCKCYTVKDKGKEKNKENESEKENEKDSKKIKCLMPELICSEPRPKRKKVKGRRIKANASMRVINECMKANCCTCCCLLAEYFREILRLFCLQNDTQLSEILSELCQVTGCICNNCLNLLKKLMNCICIPIKM